MHDTELFTIGWDFRTNGEQSMITTGLSVRFGSHRIYLFSSPLQDIHNDGWTLHLNKGLLLEYPQGPKVIQWDFRTREVDLSHKLRRN